MYWNGQKCAPKLTYDQPCTNMFLSECLDSERTFCSPISSKCVCPTGQYFNTHDRKCMDQVAEFGQCFPSMANMCISPMTCKQNQTCMCDDDEFFKNSTLQCITKFLNGSVCNKNQECSESKGLTCLNNRCLCNSPTLTWSWGQKECKLTYNAVGCTTNSNCNEDENLFCRLNGENCFQNITGFFCDCMREKDKEYYWNGIECVKAISYGGLCINDCQCQTLTQLTVCNNNHCQCRNDLEGDFLNNQCKYCYIDELYFDYKCYFVPEDEEKLDEAKKFCKNERKLAKVSSIEILDFFKVTFTGSIKYWVEDSKEAEIFCNLNDHKDLHWDPQIECLSDSISKKEKLPFICERDLN